MKRLRIFMSVLGFGLFILGCASKAEKMRGVTATPFEPLPASVVAYEGRGVSVNSNLRLAMDEAFSQATRNLASEIYRVFSTDIREITTNEKDQDYLLDLTHEVVIRLPLPGKMFREDRRRGEEYWVRVYMSKAEVDRNIGQQLIQMSQNLLSTVEEKLKERIREFNTRVDSDLRILNSFHQVSGKFYSKD